MSKSRIVKSIILILALAILSFQQIQIRLKTFPIALRTAGRVRYLHQGFLRRLELALYYAIVIPLVAFLPARIAYRLACLRADVLYRLDRPRRKLILRSLQVVLGDHLSQAERARVARDHLRERSCEAVDIIRLAGSGRALARLVEMRGLEHLKAALAGGKGAILCSAHFGSYDSCFSLLGIQGFPVTMVGRWPSRSDGDRSWLEHFVLQHLYQKPVARHRHRPNIEPHAGRIAVAFRAARILRQNELLGILVDPPVLAADRERAVPVRFLNGQAWLLPGVVTLAQATGAPVLMVFMYRTGDWQHQVLEISPPVPVEGDPAAAFERCVALVAGAIRQHPAHWRYWNPLPLAELGLLPKEVVEGFT